ncbi:MAG: CPBP family intramembrane metalloprotease [Hespellia sp.]|nr:CPBP family intramembrane metalloprotease [Hespellia sp.]
MEKKKQNRGFWYMIGPLILYWIVDLIAVTLAETVCIIGYVMKHITQINDVEAASRFMTDNIDKIYEMITAHSVELTTIGSLATLILTVSIFVMDRKKGLQLELPIDVKAPTWRYGILVLFGIFACIGLNNLANMAGLAFYSEAYQKTSEVFYSAGFAVQLLCLGIIIPISEEFIFRGIIFKRYRPITGVMSAALYSSLLFALSHGNMVQFVYALITGFFLAYVYEKYASVKAPICLHIIMNLTSLIVTQLNGFTWMFSNFSRLSISTIGCTFISACTFVGIQQIGAPFGGTDKKDSNKPDNQITPDMFR